MSREQRGVHPRARSDPHGGIISNADWEIRWVAFNRATASLREAESTLKQISEVRPVDVSVARTDLMTEKASLQSAEANPEHIF
jgi:hypothetical protein